MAPGKAGSLDYGGEVIVPNNIAAKKEEDFVIKGIPPEKAQQMIEYGKMLRKKFPHMKKERLGRKIAEYFKVKLT